MSDAKAYLKAVGGVRLATSTVALAIAMLHSGMAAAQASPEEQAPATQPTATPAPANQGIADIVVTAQRREERLQNVPIAVSAFSGALLKNNGLDAVVALPRLTPGLVLNQGAGFVSPYIRGIGTQYANLGLEPSIAIYTDDVYRSRPISGISSFLDVNRIEVLKGPQGTLFGRNATGGAIRIVTNDPTDKFEGTAALTLGSFDRIMGEGVVNVPVTSNLAVRVAGSYEDRNSYMHTVFSDPKRPPDLKQFNIRGKIRWEPASNLKLLLSVDHSFKRDPEAQAFVALDDSPLSIARARGGLPATNTDFYQTGVNYQIVGKDFDKLAVRASQTAVEFRADWNLDFATLSSISTYLRSEGTSLADIDATTLPYFPTSFSEHSSAYSQELQITSVPGSPITWVAGAYYYKEKGGNLFRLGGIDATDALGIAAPPGVGVFNSTNPYIGLLAHVQAESFAPYAEGTYHVTPKLSLTAGVRYTWETKTLLDNENYFGNVGSSNLVYFQASDIKYHFGKFTPRFIASYKPADKVMVYASYSRGFKSGGVNTPGSQTSEIKPEVLDAYEIGLKTDFRTFRFTAAGFYYNYSNLQVQRTVPSGNLVENAGKARIYGLEADIVVEPLRGLQLGLGGSYINSKYKTFEGTGQVPAFSSAACAAAGGITAGSIPVPCQGYVDEEQDFSGNRLVNAPEWSGYARIGYHYDLGRAGGLDFTGIANYTGKYYYDFGNTVSEPAHAIVSTSIGWEAANKAYSLTFFVDNLFKKKYYAYVAVFTAGNYGVPAEPRSWGLRARVNF